MSDRSKIVCIALDAADQDLLLGWAQAGVLPTVRALMERSAWGSTSTPPGLFVGAVWPSFYTGVSAARHGRYCYRQLRPGTYRVERLPAARVGANPFWAALSRADRRVAIIDVPKTGCAPLNGIQVVDWATHDPELRGFHTWPPSLARDLGARFGPAVLDTCDGRNRTAGQCADLRDALTASVARKLELTQHLLEHGPWDLFLTTFTECHCAGHQFWHIHDAADPRHDPAVARRLGDPLRDVYIAIDAAIGRLLQRIESQATVFVASSHGMARHGDMSPALDEILRRIEGAPPNVSRRRVLPTILRRAWQRIPAALRGRLKPARNRVVERLERKALAVDSNRQCFAIPNNDVYGGIRVNLAGREPQGRIRPGRDYEELCERLRRDLCELRDAETGAPVVRAVLRTADWHRGPLLDHLPDLLVEWSREPTRAVTSSRIGIIQCQMNFGRTGDHLPYGCYFAYGPSIEPGHIKQSVEVMDFAPTFAELLGVRLDDVDGRSFAALLHRTQPVVAALS